MEFLSWNERMLNSNNKAYEITKFPDKSKYIDKYRIL